ncbi:MAG: hypothetical protein GWP91_23150 [Rhodobacterales bacterium]|nr:hypothetical protein [Rhodobacterales bacterium]
MLPLLMLTLLACHKTPVVEEPPPTEVVAAEPEETPTVVQPTNTTDDWPGTDQQFTIYRTLSLRDGIPECAVVTADSADALGDLVFIAENIPLPPQAGMLAANCVLSEHAEAAVENLVRWSTSPETAGLARLVFGKLDVLPLEVSTVVREAALAGPHAALVPDPG